MVGAMNRSLSVVALFLVLGLGACGTPPGREPPSPVAALDLARYAGRWFELAKYPNRFQAQCIGDTTAEYELLPDGAVKVTNRCRVAGGEIDQAIGRAERVEDGSVARLKVRFAPDWLSWVPLVWGDYWVIDLDPAYSLAAVSDPDRRYLWILSRTPSVDEGRYRALLTRLQQAGFETSRLESTRQNSTER